MKKKKKNEFCAQKENVSIINDVKKKKKGPIKC